MPLVKYVDLDMVSSPTRPRPGPTATGMRRQSQGSNSSSPDPHQNRSGASGNAAAGMKNSRANPSSPSSPALQAAPHSPLPFRTKHYAVYRQDSSGAKDRFSSSGVEKIAAAVASPSHPSQCSSPFSRPSSRSQDASPNPQDLLGSMCPPAFLPFVEGGAPARSNNSAAVVAAAAAAASSSPNSSGSNCLPALPKFQQAFGKKNHFDVLPVLNNLTEAPGTSSSISAGNHMHQDPLQVSRYSFLLCGAWCFFLGGLSAGRWPLKNLAKIGLFFVCAAVGGFFRRAKCWSMAV